MKPWSLLVILLCFALAAPESEARGVNRGGGAGAHRGGGGGGARMANRSPMTGSRISRPAPRPVNRPAVRPTPRPAPRPSANRPAVRPAPSRPSVNKPAVRPTPRPTPQPGVRPGAGGAGTQRPGIDRPGTRPGAGGGGVQRPDIDRPGTRPGAGGGGVPKPGIDRPGVRPGQGGGGIQRPDPTRPGRPGDLKPGLNRPGVTYPTRPGINRPGVVNRPNINVNRPNVNINRPVINRPNLNVRPRPEWNNKWGNNWGHWGGGNKVNNIHINNNFHNNLNWSYRPNYWGNRPWWGAGAYHPWHHGNWNYGWNRPWYNRYRPWYGYRPWPGYVVYDNDNNVAEGIAWGLAAWGLGNLIYNVGYQTYSNPYPAPAVQTVSGSSFSYSQPVSVSAADYPPGDETAAKTAGDKSDTSLDRSRDAFKNGDYLTALKSVDEALAVEPGDTALHEYRALVLFALGKYSEAAGVLNATLASGPGWDWSTMVGFYPSSDVYTGQLRKLEKYVTSKPDAADSRFLLGYHYMVCGHLDRAYDQFEEVVKLQPADTVARQLRDLVKNSLPTDDDDETGKEPDSPPAVPTPEPVDTAKLVGTWITDRGKDGKITLNLATDGAFSWLYDHGGKSSELKGNYSINEKGLLVLAAEDSQMVGKVTLPKDDELTFVLAGGPEGDPGLSFTKH